ncbi:hypothetical protein MTO96_007783 [Rhipicephalus appendiculatus]
MNHPVIFLLFGVTFCASDDVTINSRLNQLWVNEGRLGEFQDAWKAITQTFEQTYYLVNATYDTNDVWGENFRCVRMKTRVIDRLKEVVNVRQLLQQQTTHENVSSMAGPAIRAPSYV